MIINVAVTPDAIEELCPLEDATRVVRRRSASVVRALRDYAVVVFDSKASRKEALLRLNSRGSDSDRQLLLTLLSAQAPTARVAREDVPDLNGVVDVVSLAGWTGHADVVALSADQFDLLEGEPDIPDDPEATAVWDLTATDALGQAQLLRSAALREGTSREEAWSQRFERLCGVSQALYVVDIHLGEQVCEAYLEQDADACRGAQWFLQKVAATGLERVIIATRLPRRRERGGAGRRRNAAEVREAFGRLTEDVGLEPDRWRLFVGRSTKDWKFPHERHLRFDRRLVVPLHNGLQTFEHEVFLESATCQVSAEAVDAMALVFQRIRDHQEP